MITLSPVRSPVVNGAAAANFVHEIKEQIEKFKGPNYAGRHGG
jgi:hypothetical protein